MSLLTTIWRLRGPIALLLLAPAGSRVVLAQRVPAVQQDAGTVLVQVRSGVAPLAAATVTAGDAMAHTDNRGEARLRLPAGEQTVAVTREGFAPATATALIRAGAETPLLVQLRELRFEDAVTVVAATRTGTVLEDQPLHVEALPQEEIEENLTIAPGNLTTLLEELPGVAVETTAPTLGGTTLRLRGLRGRYTRVLVDELPLLGDEGDAFGLLQVPPLDLAQVEVIKGTTSALYGGGALGGIVNLVSRGPAGEPEALLGQSSQRGTDLVGFLPHQLGERWGYTLLASGHRQSARDLDGDGWADLPGFRRALLRPRLYWGDQRGHSLFATAGGMDEQREGGTLAGATTTTGPFRDRLHTRRLDGGLVGRFLLPGELLLAIHASLTTTARSRRLGPDRERVALRSGFAEVSLAGSGHGRASGHTWVLGVAEDRQTVRLRGAFATVDEAKALFAQDEYALSPRVSLAASGRAERSRTYGTFVDPLVSLLLRPRPHWRLRLSAGSGHALPTPLGEETEEVGLARLLPVVGVRPERARSAALDLGWSTGGWELGGAFFASRVNHPLLARETGDRLALRNAPGAERTRGTELLARYSHGFLHVIATHAWLDATAADIDGGPRRRVARVPHQAAELAAIVENEAVGRLGAELGYTGRQRLEHDPFRATSPSYVELNVLGEVRLGEARLFAVARNLTDVRQTRRDPLLLARPEPDGRRTTDVWGPLAGRTFEVGVRFDM
ncbi:MAG TPA: TonB-dependent receptor [Thermoanaerobaculia bacterium]|nr:TonB-dependent receptor [Thermoanaerobaculia bacterium]